MGYVVGVSSGIFGAAAQEERFQGVSVGLYRKALYCITKGVQFVQIDLESISEFKEPGLEQNMQRLKDMHITFGIHSETPAFGTREFPHLDSAIEIDYERGHKRLTEILEVTGKLESKFDLMHSSESTPFLLLGRELQPSALVDIWGRALYDFLEIEKPEEKRSKKSKELVDWAISKDYIQEIFVHYHKSDIRKMEEEKIIESMVNDFRNRWHAEHREAPPEEEQKRWENTALEMIKDKKVQDLVEERTNNILRRQFESFLKSKTLSYGPERVAYYVIGKWLEDPECPLHKMWKNIINATIDYHRKLESSDKGKPMSREEWLEKKGIKKLTLDDESDKFRLLYQLWVPPVSAAYVWGHFNQNKCVNADGSPGEEWKKKKIYDDPKEIIEKYKDKGFVFTLETPMASPGIEEHLRFPNPVQIYYLCEAVGFEYMQMAIDIEHMLMSNQDPEVTFDTFPEGAGKYVRVVHAGWPAPLGPAHLPITVGSEQHIYLYKMYYKLRQKGFGKGDGDYYIVFERTGGADPIQQSITALKLITKFLEKDTPWDKLPNEFFGMDVGQIASRERQWVAIEEHARDPLKGLIVVPEEEYTFLGRAALEKGKRPDEWKKEELR